MSSVEFTLVLLLFSFFFRLQRDWFGQIREWLCPISLLSRSRSNKLLLALLAWRDCVDLSNLVHFGFAYGDVDIFWSCNTQQVAAIESELTSQLEQKKCQLRVVVLNCHLLRKRSLTRKCDKALGSWVMWKVGYDYSHNEILYRRFVFSDSFWMNGPPKSNGSTMKHA